MTAKHKVGKAFTVVISLSEIDRLRNMLVNELLKDDSRKDFQTSHSVCFKGHLTEHKGEGKGKNRTFMHLMDVVPKFDKEYMEKVHERMKQEIKVKHK